MAINFPNNPSVNDTHTVGGTTYTWDGTVWVTGSISSPTFELVQDTTPQLGGDLDLNNKDITGTGDINITGIITATSFGGTVASSNLSGVIPDSSFPSVLPAVSGANLTNLNLSNLNASNLSSGTIPDARFPSVLPALDGSALTGIQGLAEPLSNTAPLNKFLKTPKTINIGAGTSLTVESDASSGNVAFVKEGTIHVSVGGTFHVKNNTKLQLNVLGIF
jgi:hypothetical protein